MSVVYYNCLGVKKLCLAARSLSTVLGDLNPANFAVRFAWRQADRLPLCVGASRGHESRVFV